MTGSERQKRHRQKLLAQGLCTICKQKSDNLPKQRCKKCTSTIAKKYNQKRRKERYESGLCKNCGINPFVEGYKWCYNCRDKQRKWYKNSNYREKNRILDKQRRKERKLRIIQHYGEKCVCCGETELMFLSIDHINENGAKHRAEIMGSPEKGRRMGSVVFYKWLEKNNYPDGLQVLCHNCNMGKHLNGGTCPHKNNI